jgi:hypothetical protein
MMSCPAQEFLYALGADFLVRGEPRANTCARATSKEGAAAGCWYRA